MKKELKNNSDKHHGEKGIALIFTLGVLTILLILGLAFVMMVKTNRKLASLNTDVTTAKLSAESALERIIGSIELYNDDLTQGKIYPGTSSFFKVTSASDDGWDQRRVIFSHETDTLKQTNDWIYKFKTSFANSANLDYISWESTGELNEILKNIHWKYIKTNDGKSDIILGRIAYIIIDESGKLDPNYIKTGGTIIGKDVSEINLTNSGIDSPEKFTTPPDKAPKWFSWSHILGTYDDNGTQKDNITDLTQNNLNSYTGVIFPFSMKDPEAFWIDNNSNNKVDEGELYHRFNLARYTDKDGNGKYEEGIDDNDYWNSLNSITDFETAPSSPWDDSTTHDGTDIPWIANWQNSNKNQIIANLIDYCDSNSIPHTDSDGTSAPTYLGLEKTAYLNEISVNLSQTVVTKKAIDGGAEYSWPSINILITPEIVNVYADQVGACDLELSYTINGVVNKDLPDPETPLSYDLTPISGTLTYNFTATQAKSFNTAAQQQVNFPLGSYETADLGIDKMNLTITDIKLTAYLKDSNGNLIDYSTVASDSNSVNLDLHPSQKFANYQTNDPRFNQALSQWTTNTGENDLATLGTNNSSCRPGDSGDKETGSNPWVSTCYIRNAPMESPWELGAIHRGAAWETINLKAFNDGASGGSSYSDGDANILDQVKMTSATLNPGKVNINSPVIDVQKALVNISVGGDYTNSSVGVPCDTSTISQAILDDNGTTIDSVTNKALGAAFTNRAKLADTAELGTGQTTDATKEEIIGKCINLTTVRQNLFTVIILAQTIKDVGGVGSDIPINKDLDSDGDVSGSVVEGKKDPVSEKIIGWDIDGDGNISISPITDPQAGLDDNDNGIDDDDNPETILTRLGRYDQYADEIVAEQKIMAVIYRDAYTNKCKILYYQFLE